LRRYFGAKKLQRLKVSREKLLNLLSYKNSRQNVGEIDSCCSTVDTEKNNSIQLKMFLSICQTALRKRDKLSKKYLKNTFRISKVSDVIRRFLTAACCPRGPLFPSKKWS